MQYYRIYYCLQHDDIIIQNNEDPMCNCTIDSLNCAQHFIANAHNHQGKWVLLSDDSNIITEQDLESFFDRCNGGITLSILYNLLNEYNQELF